MADTSQKANAVAQDDAGEEEVDNTPTNPDVALKYKTAGKFADQVMKEAIAKCVPGAKLLEICQFADDLITSLCQAVYTKKNKHTGQPVPRGIATPTCISVNNIVCHYSPDTDDSTVLVSGDVARIDLAVHIDGFVAATASTIIVGTEADLDPTLRSKYADVVHAAITCQEACVRAFRPGSNNYDVTDTIARVCADFGVAACEGVLSHRMSQFTPDEPECIIQRRVTEPPQRVEVVNFEVGQVWQLDVLITSGLGRLRQQDLKPTVYRRVPGGTSGLRMRTAREVMGMINSHFYNLPFSLRQLPDRKGRFGVTECKDKGLLAPSPILLEKGGEVVAHLKTTVVILPSSIDRICYTPPVAVPSDKALASPQVKELLQRGLSLAAKKKKKPAAKKQ